MDKYFALSNTEESMGKKKSMDQSPDIVLYQDTSTFVWRVVRPRYDSFPNLKAVRRNAHFNAMRFKGLQLFKLFLHSMENREENRTLPWSGH